MGEKLRIDTIFAYIAENPEGEGIVGGLMPNGTWMPFIGADSRRVESLREMAQATANSTGLKIRVVEFSQRKELGVIEPKVKHG